MEPKAKTFIEESGIFDSELSTKKHDSIVLSLLEKEKMKEVILSAYPDVREGLGHWASDCVISDPQSAHKVLELPAWDVVNERLTAHEICEVFKRKHPSSSINVDYVRRQVLRLQDEASAFRLLERPAVDITAMYPITRGKSDEKTIVGYVDFFVTLTYRGTTHFSPFKSSRMRRSDFFVEVRMKVANVGAVLKQIRTYMEFTKARPILVSSVNKSVKKAIETQGIPVYLWNAR